MNNFVRVIISPNLAIAIPNFPDKIVPVRKVSVQVILWGEKHEGGSCELGRGTVLYWESAWELSAL